MVREVLVISDDTMVPTPLSSGRKRQTFPDVPEDVTLAALHWNDPNYDIDSLPSPTLSSTSFELEPKDLKSSSARYSTSEFDTESRVDSMGPQGSEARLGAQEEFDEYVVIIISLFQLSNPPITASHRMPRFELQYRTSTTH
jgi:hypothetical protein